ncbi:hypothetical protein SAMD00019534_049440 [Acytostelium subglobosum LB1]|uniref:hypothetical protein n=1 Tax=Acytostelium subglobosum LB1 TaxID=1410327 RepID=UPI000644D4A6|nr:hypothetical protein SAMD00019534_049440 [Acytostelium subglobosum LB1]GAM21769.1 hypothetical protein SAMD00019534_049440 [Acytostelium subglobosum LB1]|eukprot:XP_012754869.1 hypothetical protein SAMD00019534_049440 [Acytostelium subglobosum LB1]
MNMLLVHDPDNDTKTIILDIIKSGSTDLVNAVRSVSDILESGCHLQADDILWAVNHGDEHFVQLIHQLGLCTGMSQNQSIELTCADIKLSMVEMLHKLGILNHEGIRYTVFRTSFMCDSTDTIKYLMDNTQPGTNNKHVGQVKEGVFHCATHGYLATLKVLMQFPDARDWDYKQPIRCAARRGHVHIIEYLHSFGPTRIPSDGFLLNDLIGTIHNGEIDQLQASQYLYRMNTDAFTGALKSRDYLRADAILDAHPNSFGEDSPVWSNISLKQCRYFATRRPNIPRRIGVWQLNYIIKYVKKGKLTVNEAVTFLSKCPQVGGYHYLAPEFSEPVVVAAGISLPLMQELNRVSNESYDGYCLARSIKRSCFETMEFLLNQPDGFYIERSSMHKSMKALMTSGSIKAISLIKERLPNELQPLQCAYAVRNTLEVFLHVMHMHSPESLTKHLRSIINKAIRYDKPDSLRALREYINDDLVEFPMPTLSKLQKAAESNSYRSLEYMFVTSPSSFQTLSNGQLLRSLHTINQTAFDCGLTRIIQMCAKLIPSTKPDNDHVSAIKTPEVATTGSSSKIHLVLTDAKLSSIIFGHVGRIHRTCLMIDESNLMKGRQLWDSQSLLSYIKFGANSWVAKSLDDLMSHPLATRSINHHLVKAALVHHNYHALVLLLKHPSMSLDYKNKVTTIVTALLGLSSCDNPHWSDILDMIMSVTSNEQIIIEGDNYLIAIEHPEFLQRLLSLGARVGSFSDQFNFQHVKWISKPWAVDMFQLMDVNDMLSIINKNTLLGKALKRSATGLVQYIINEQSFGDMAHQIKIGHNLVHRCCKGGHIEMLNILLPHIPLRQLTAGCRVALQYGHIDLLEALLAQLLVTEFDTKNEPLKIDCIHQSVLSITLLKSLMALPQLFKCTFSLVMSEAIVIGDRTVIDFLDNQINDECPISTNYCHAMSTAAYVGDTITMRMIMDSNRIYLPMPNKISIGLGREELPCMWNGVRPEIAEMIVKNLQAKSRSITVGDLNNIVDAVDWPGTMMTEKVVVAFINTWSGVRIPNGTRLSQTFHRLATSGSLAMNKLIESNDILIELISKHINCQDIVEVICLLVSRGQYQYVGNLIQLAVSKSDSSSPLPVLIKSILKSPIMDPTVLQLLVDNQYLDILVDKQRYIQRVIDQACESGNLDAIKYIHTQWPSMLPTQHSLGRAAKRNHLPIIQYLLFDSSSMTSNSALIVRTVNYARYSAFKNGNLKVIQLCDKFVLEGKYD